MQIGADTRQSIEPARTSGFFGETQGGVPRFWTGETAKRSGHADPARQSRTIELLRHQGMMADRCVPPDPSEAASSDASAWSRLAAAEGRAFFAQPADVKAYVGLFEAQLAGDDVRTRTELEKVADAIDPGNADPRQVALAANLYRQLVDIDISAATIGALRNRHERSKLNGELVVLTAGRTESGGKGATVPDIAGILYVISKGNMPADTTVISQAEIGGTLVSDRPEGERFIYASHEGFRPGHAGAFPGHHILARLYEAVLAKAGPQPYVQTAPMPGWRPIYREMGMFADTDPADANRMKLVVLPDKASLHAAADAERLIVSGLLEKKTKQVEQEGDKAPDWMRREQQALEKEKTVLAIQRPELDDGVGFEPRLGRYAGKWKRSLEGFEI